MDYFCEFTFRDDQDQTVCEDSPKPATFQLHFQTVLNEVIPFVHQTKRNGLLKISRFHQLSSLNVNHYLLIFKKYIFNTSALETFTFATIPVVCTTNKQP